MAGRGNAGNAGRGVLKQAIKDLETRVTNTEQRLDRVETTVELSEGYRRLRVEHSTKLDELWTKFTNKEVEGRDMRNLATTALTQEIREVLGREWQENELQQKSNTLSNGRRTLPSPEVRATLAREFSMGSLVEWVSKDRAGGYQIILQRGEPSRVFTEQIRSQVNWVLYVLSKMAEPQNGVQIYMDRGPKQRAKGQGKAGQGKGGKGRGKAKGKAKGGNAKGGKGRGKGREENTDDMET